MGTEDIIIAEAITIKGGRGENGMVDDQTTNPSHRRPSHTAGSAFDFGFGVSGAADGVREKHPLGKGEAARILDHYGCGALASLIPEGIAS